MQGSSSLDGRVAVVTGAGAGLGRAEALALARAGADLVLADVSDDVHAVVDEAVALGVKATAVVGDVSETAVADRITATAVERFGGLHVLVNNAGVLRDRMVFTMSDEEWDEVVRVHLRGHFLLSRNAAAHWRDRHKQTGENSGSVVNTASEAGLRGGASGTAYTASKHGVIGLTRSLAVMYRDAGIRTNAIAPGGTNTGISPDIDFEAHGPSAIMPYMAAMGRVAEPEEQAAAIAFLASDAASNINGVVLPVDNGWAAA